LIIRIIFDENRSWSSSLRSLLYSVVTSSFLGPSIFLSTLFSNILRIRSASNVRDQVSHPYRTTGKIIVTGWMLHSYIALDLSVLSSHQLTISHP
jgi:hypothetical protein